MDRMAEPGPSRSGAIARPTLDHLDVARAVSEQPNTSLPNATYITSSISGGTINNVNGDLHNINNFVNHNYHGISSVTSIDPASKPLPPIPPFNGAPIDLISSCFTGREVELEFITISFNTFQSDKPTRFVIYGMPGLGKSQLALQHANLAFTAGVYSHVFYVSATTVEKLGQGLARILGLLNHAERNHPDQAAQIAAVRLWLEQSDHHGCRRWLLILDNVTAESAKFLREHLPRQNAGGTILITTRTRNIAEAVANAAGQKHIIFELKALSKAESVSLLLKKAGIDGAPIDLAGAEELVSRMGCLPLAVQQAGSYMKRSGLKNTNQLQEMYYQRGLSEIQKLEEIDPDAHKLLKTLAFLDPENIPIDILSLGARAISERLAKNGQQSLILSPNSQRKEPAIRRLLKKLKGKLHMESNPLEGVPSELTVLIALFCSEGRIRAAFRHFEDLSIAQPLYDDKPSLHIHDLIQWVLQQSALVHREEGYRVLAIALLCNAFQTIDDPRSPQSWDQCEIFVPHFMALETQDWTHSMISEEYMIANESIAEYFSSRGRYKEAETLLVRVLAHRRRLLGSKDISTFNTMHSLAGVYEDLGRYEEAELLYLPLLAADKKRFGADHQRTLTTVSNLAGLYESQGKLDKAESLYVRVLIGEEKQLGADHPDTLTTMNNLAGLYKSQGKLGEAESLCRRALAGREKQLGADHPSTLVTVNNLALLYESQGRLDEAQSLYVRALQGQEKQLGADHPTTLVTVNQLAGLYEIQGEFDEAESLYVRALAGREKQLGADHPSTLLTVHNFAYLRKKQGRQQEAEVLYRRALAGLEATLGPDHHDTQTTLCNLVEDLEAQGHYQEAEVLRERMTQSNL
ncbi:TPR-like protein [Athelia psychrophila]|uniref:TPR-like protein n=1 Tax=Athelia psychrophila TaxID=1759441 RepID=A0A166PV33_9AGAM|nr:TPR-like protein [Fibularhizoctonia sp. CBS 109695]